MPELPEVETIVRELQALGLEGKRVVDAVVYWPRTVSPMTPERFTDQLRGQSICKISRRGKWIEIELSRDKLYVHLRMTGKILFCELSDVDRRNERLRLSFDDGRVLHYEDQRKFGRWALVSKNFEMTNLGVEPLSEQFTWEYFASLFKGSHQRIKTLLLNQKYIVGLGNIYVDEALWFAKIHPMRQSDRLTQAELKRLYLEIPKVLLKGIENRGTSLGDSRSNYFDVSGKRGGNQYKLNVFRREGEACYRCGDVIRKLVLAQRGTHFCPTCQKLK